MNPDGSSGGGGGGPVYVYDTPIDTLGLPAQVISIEVWHDDRLDDISLGGSTIPGGFGLGFNANTGDGSGSIYTFGVAANTLQSLTFTVTDIIPIATGLRVQVQNVSAIPEPSTYALVGLGLVGLAVLRRRRNRV